ncbi:MAG: large repetitive protein, partial [Frankiaceae bacterium]|nr:large repetitive protein [Frankiaceae bacterium]
PGGAKVSTSGAQSAVVTGLSNGTSYTFTVHATNAVGDSVESAPSAAVTPTSAPTAPGAPTGVTAAAGDAQASVSWTAASSGGSPVTGYTVTASPGGASVTTSGATSVVVPGLTNGTSYTFKVSAKNAVGTGPLSAASNAVTPVAAGAPVKPVAVPGATVATGAGANTSTLTTPGFGVAVPVGDTVFVLVTERHLSAAPTLSSVTDSAGNVYVRDGTGGSSVAPLYVLRSNVTHAISSATTLTVSFAGAAADEIAVVVDRLPGSATVDGPTPVATTVGPPQTVHQFTLTAPHNGDVVFGGNAFSGIGGFPVTVGGSSFTAAGQVGSPNRSLVAFAEASATGAVETVTDTWSSAHIGTILAIPYTVAPTAGATAPGSPANVVATGGNAQASVTWSAPATNGGSPVTGYTVTAAPGGASVSTSGAQSAVVTGLTNGTTYTFTVTATNAVGASAPSAASNAVTPAAAPTAPAAPTGATATAGDAQALVSWTAPSSNGGSPITGYTVTAAPGGATASTAGGTSVVVPGLANGTSYTFTVTATNAVGTSAPSAASNAVTPTATTTAPSAPVNVTATAGDAQATVSWNAPATNGGSAVTGYTVIASPGGATATTSGATTVVVAGLANGTSYTFTVKATNAVGTGPASAVSNAVTPAAAVTSPGAPTGVTATAGDAQASVTWSAPATNGGAPISGYTVTATPGGATASTSGATSVVVPGLTNGTSYTFRVTATNSVGTGPASAASNAVTPVAAAPAVKPIAVPGATTATGAGANATSLTTPGFGVAVPVGATVFAIVTERHLSAAPVLSSVTDSAGNVYTRDTGGGSAVAPVYVLRSNVTHAISASTTLTVQFTGGAADEIAVVVDRLAGSASVDGAAPTPTTVGPSQTVHQVTVTAPRSGDLVFGGNAFSGTGGLPVTVAGSSFSAVGQVGSPNRSLVAFADAPATGAAETVTDTWSSAHIGSIVAVPYTVVPSAAATVPGAPANVVASAGDAQASVSWSAPASTGGSAITGYTVTAAPGGATATTSGAQNAVVTGLVNGTSYTFTVTATNAVGTGPASAASNAVTPSTAQSAPGAPTSVVATAGDAQASVSWSAPSSNGGSAVTGYTVTATPGGASATTTGATTVVVPGLVNGTSYTFKVTATNAIGTGPASAASNTVTPTAAAVVPGAPTNVVATAGDTQASVSWSAPSSNGGSAVTGYTVTATPGGASATTTGARTVVVPGLTNGTSYTFKVTATNAIGTGPASAASNAVTPFAAATTIQVVAASPVDPGTLLPQLIGTDTYTGGGAQHATELEPTAFSHGSTIVSVSQVGRFGNTGAATNMAWSTSKDGGATWTSGVLAGITTAGGGPWERVVDQSVAYDAVHGQWLIGALGVGLLNGSYQEQQLYVVRSSDGLNWGTPVSVFLGEPDKEWVTCDNQAASPYRGTCYALFQLQSTSPADAFRLSKSVDGGLTWSAPIGTPGSSTGYNVQPLVEPDGTLVVFATDYNEANTLVLRSLDGGATLTDAAVVSPIQRHSPPGLRYHPKPTFGIAADGKLYAVWADCRFRASCGANDLVMTTSTDDGVHWSSVARIALDPVSSSVDRFFPALAVDTATSGGGTHLALLYHYYPVAACGGSSQPACVVDVAVVTSNDAGATWSAPTVLTPTPQSLTWLPSSLGRMPGDYFGATFSNGNAVVVFPVAHAPSGTTFDQSIFAAVIGDDTLAVGDTTFAEPSTGSQGMATFQVQLSAPQATDVTATYKTVDGTASQAAGDYVGGTGTLTIPAGSLAVSVQVPVPANGLAAGKTFTLRLSNVTGATLARAIGTATSS